MSIAAFQFFSSMPITARVILVFVSIGFPVGGLGEELTSFSEILVEQDALTFKKVKGYVEEHPDAADVETAYAWLFKTARKHRWESELFDHTVHYLKRQEALSRDLAIEVRLLAWGRTGQWEDAAWEWERLLGEARLAVQAENLKTAALGNELAIEAQLAGKIEIAQDIYKKLMRRLFLNQGIQTLCKSKLAKLELIGKKAPRIGTVDLERRPIRLADNQDKWLLVDFWATDCLPCREAFPEWQRLYQQYHSQGFEIIGISLDEDPAKVRAFLKQRNIRWNQALSSSDVGKTKERYRVDTIPSTFLIEPAGEVLLIDPSPRDVEEVLVGKLPP